MTRQDKTQNKKSPFDKIVKNYVEKGQQITPKETFKKYNITKPKGILDITGWKYKLTNKYNPLSTVKINMELSNGQEFPFIVKIKNGGFIFDNGFYIIDEKYKYYDANAKLWCFDYHEELAFPIDKQVKISDVKKKLYESNEIELETAVNPKSLQKFMESTVIQKVLAGGQMEDSMKKMKTMILLTLILIGITLLIVLNNSGILA